MKPKNKTTHVICHPAIHRDSLPPSLLLLLVTYTDTKGERLFTGVDRRVPRLPAWLSFFFFWSSFCYLDGSFPFFLGMTLQGRELGLDDRIDRGGTEEAGQGVREEEEEDDCTLLWGGP